MAPKVTEEYKQTVREEILQAAEDLFARKGYHKTSMDDIVKESGLSKGAIYGYFESKQDILLALSDRRCASILDRIQSVFSPDDSATDKLEKGLGIVFGDLVEVSREICGLSLELWVEAPRIKSLQDGVNIRYGTAHSFIAGIINEGMRRGEFKQDIDADAMASILLATVDGMYLHWATTGRDFDWQKMKSTFLAMLLEGINVEGKGTGKGDR